MRDLNYTADLSYSLAEQLRLDTAASARSATPPQPRRSKHPSDNRPSKSTTSKSKPRPIPGARGPSPMDEYMQAQASTNSLTKLQDLPSTATLLLLTPAIIPVGHQIESPAASNATAADSDEKIPAPAAKSTQSDPFETLGRTIATHHPRLRHVPFVAPVGLTKTHAVFLSHADAVLVITAAPACTSQDEIDASVRMQADFVHGVAEWLTQAGMVDGKVKPMVNFAFGDDKWEHKSRDGYDHVFVGDVYGVESAGNIVEIVLGGRKRKF